MHSAFVIRQAGGRTVAAIKGMPPGGRRLPHPTVIPVFIPMSGCRHHCVFCNQTVITGQPSATPSKDAVARTVEAFLPFVQHRRRPIQIAFFGGNFLGLPEPMVHALLSAAAAFVARGQAQGIRFSTRPDTISVERLAALQDFPVTTIEIGLQSLNDRVLTLVRRGHDAACTVEAARLVKAAGYELGLQMMTGLPGDTFQGALHTAESMLKLKPDFVRIYPTLVLAPSVLADQFRSGTYIPAGLGETVELVSRLFLLFTAADIRVIRMGLQADEALSSPGSVLAGPFHPALGEQVYSHIFFALAAAALDRQPDWPPGVTIRVHPRHLSRMIGAGRGNLRRLKTRFTLPAIAIRGDAAVGPHHLEVDKSPLDVASI